MGSNYVRTIEVKTLVEKKKNDMTSNYNNIVDAIIIINVVIIISLHHKFVPRGTEGQERIISTKWAATKVNKEKNGFLV